MSNTRCQFLSDFEGAAMDAVSRGARMRVVRKGGEVTEGVVDEVLVDAGTGGYGPTSDADRMTALMLVEPEDEIPRQCVVKLAGAEILGQEVGSYSVDGGAVHHSP